MISLTIFFFIFFSFQTSSFKFIQNHSSSDRVKKGSRGQRSSKIYIEPSNVIIHLRFLSFPRPILIPNLKSGVKSKAYIIGKSGRPMVYNRMSQMTGSGLRSNMDVILDWHWTSKQMTVQFDSRAFTFTQWDRPFVPVSLVTRRHPTLSHFSLSLTFKTTFYQMFILKNCLNWILY